MPVTPAGIHYDDSLHGGEPVVFLHGVTLDRRMWAAQVDALAGSHVLWSPFRRLRQPECQCRRR